MTFLLSFNDIGLLVATLALLMILRELDVNSFMNVSTYTDYAIVFLFYQKLAD